MFKSTKEFNQAVCVVLHSIMKGSIKFSEMTEWKNETWSETDFIDVLDFIESKDFVLGLEFSTKIYKNTELSIDSRIRKKLIQKPDKYEESRLSYAGLEFLENHSK